MKITFFGIGYVGLVSGVCLAETGNTVTCFDIDKDRVEGLKKGISPIFEPGLSELIVSNLNKNRVTFTAAVEEAIDGSDVYFIAVGTPSGENGSVDLSYVDSCSRMIGENISDKDFTVVVKSTVPAGTSDRVRKIIEECLEKRGLKTKFHMASNPEFLREGSSVNDFMNPDRIVIGTADQETADKMEAIYTGFEGRTEFIYCDIRTAEVAKYAANAMLASRISFMNEISRVCQKVSGDVEKVKRILGTDARIGNKFLNAGVGYGGSCFPKDVKELIHFAEELGIDPIMFKSIHETNERQKDHFYRLVKEVIEKEGAKKIGVLGIAFKAGTDDTRDAPSVYIMERLIEEGYSVLAYDPEAMEVYRKNNKPTVALAKNTQEVIDNSDVIVIVTEWHEFKKAVEDNAKKRTLTVVDGRNMLEKEDLNELNIKYYSVGRPPVIGKNNEEV